MVLVLVDCLRACNVGCCGGKVPDTPHMDRLADRGFSFRRAFVQAPHTQPSTASILTSLYPSCHGVITPQNRFDSEVIRAGEIFRALGYETAAFVANPHINPESGHLEGLDYFTDGRNWLKRRSWRLGHWGEPAPVLNRYFYRWFKQQRAPHQPFLTFIFYIDTHNPYTTLPNMFHRFLNQKLHYPKFHEYEYSDEEMEQLDHLYRKQVRRVDWSIGDLIRFLKEERVWDNTLFVLTSDHGEGLDRRPGHGFHGQLYEKGVHVPLIVSAPWLAAAPQTFGNLVASIDILPSILELLDLPVYFQFQGESFASLLQGKSYQERQYVAGELNRSRYIRTKGWKYINRTVGFFGPNPRWSGQEDLLRFEEIYDLEKDPNEERNLIQEVGKDVLMRLRSFHQQLSRVLQEQPYQSETYDVDEDVLQRLRGLGYIE
jgi:arylsulfatase A-like enzyme